MCIFVCIRSVFRGQRLTLNAAPQKLSTVFESPETGSLMCLSSPGRLDKPTNPPIASSLRMRLQMCSTRPLGVEPRLLLAQQDSSTELSPQHTS